MCSFDHDHVSFYIVPFRDLSPRSVHFWEMLVELPSGLACHFDREAELKRGSSVCHASSMDCNHRVL